MHDDDGLIPREPQAQIKLRHFDRPVSVRELLHSTLDRLLSAMILHSEPQGVVAVTCMQGTGEFAGRTVVLALDLDPAAQEYDGLGNGLGAGA
jgi:hypothetical protein